MADVRYNVILDFKTEGAATQGSVVKKQIAAPLSASATNVKELNSAFSEMMKLEQFKSMGGDIKSYNSRLDELQSTVSGLGGNFGLMSKQAKKMSQTFDMSSLSVMFFGMAMQRFFLGNFNAMLNTFKMLDKKGIMPLNRALTKMEAAWSFLSFSIMKAMEPVLLPLIDSLVSLVDWFSELDPSILGVVGSVTLLLGALGAIGLLFGTIKLGLGGLGAAGALDAVLGRGAAGAIGGLAKGALTLAIGVSFVWVGWEAFLAGGKTLLDGLKEGDVGKAATGAGVALGGLLLLAFGGVLIAGVIVQVATALGFIGTAGATTAAATTAGATLGTAFVAGIAGALMLVTVAGILAVAIGGMFLMAIGMINDRELGKSGNEISPELLAQKKALEESGFAVNMGIDMNTGQRKLDVKSFAQTQKETQDMLAGAFNRTPEQEAIFQKQLIDWKASGSAVSTNIASGITESKPLVDQALTQTLAVPTATAIVNITDSSGTGGSLMITNFADKVTETTPYLIDSITVSFTAATKVMETIVHDSVERVIADVNRAISALRSLEAAKSASASTSTVSNTTNNANKIVINAASTANITKSIQSANAAVPVSRF